MSGRGGQRPLRLLDGFGHRNRFRRASKNSKTLASAYCSPVEFENQQRSLESPPEWPTRNAAALIVDLLDDSVRLAHMIGNLKIFEGPNQITLTRRGIALLRK